MNPINKASGSAILEIAVNVVLPWLIYTRLEHRLGEVHALLIAMLPPILWSIVTFIRKRQVDAISMLVLAGIVFSLVAFLGGGSAKFLQLRENLATGFIGLIFLISAAIRRPLIYQLALAGAKRQSPSEAADLESKRNKPGFRHSMTVMTLVWGFGLILQTALACFLVFRMTIAHYLIVSPILGYGSMGLLGLWSFFYVRHRKSLAAVTETA